MAIDPNWPVKFSKETWAALTEELEGGSVVNHMFMVQDAQVASGYGITWTNKMFAERGKREARKLSWFYKPGHAKQNQICKPEDVDADYDAALNADPSLYLTNGHLPEWRKIMQCRTTAKSLLEQVYKKVASNVNVIRTAKLISNFDSLPADAQLCVVSMTWAVGPNWGESLQKNDLELFTKLLNFRRACEKMDFVEAAKFATYKSTENSIQKRAKHQRKMLENAELVSTGHGSFEECYWPGSAPRGAAAIDSAIEGAPEFGSESFLNRGMSKL